MKKNIIKLFFVVLLLISTVNSFPQSVFTVDHFSKAYYGKIAINDPTKVFSPGWVAIYEYKTNKCI